MAGTFRRGGARRSGPGLGLCQSVRRRTPGDSQRNGIAKFLFHNKPKPLKEAF